MKTYIAEMFGYVNATISEPEHPAFGKHFETPDGKSFVFFSAQLAAADLIELLREQPKSTPLWLRKDLKCFQRELNKLNLCPETLEELKTAACFAKIIETADRSFFSDDDGSLNEDVRYDLLCLRDLCGDVLAFIADRIQDTAQKRTLSDRLETIREEAICAIEQAAEKGTIKLLPEDIFDNNGQWINTITKYDHPELQNSTAKTREQLVVNMFSGNEEDCVFQYTADFVFLRTDTLVQIATFLAKN